MRVGRVFLNIEYIVDLDNEEMVQAAKEFIQDDVADMVKYNEYNGYIEREELFLDASFITQALAEMFAEDDEE
ncbi:MAG: hypothetical protein WC262_13125 [Bacteroidales bacterium]|jgi:hypothetical protein